jgi:hypothetical protein
MFGERFFDQLDETVQRYVEASDEIDVATVLVRTRLGTFNVAAVKGGEMLARLRVYPPPQGESAEGDSSASDTKAAEAHAPATDLNTLPIAYVPYAEVVLVEVMPLVGDRGYIGGLPDDSDPMIGFVKGG